MQPVQTEVHSHSNIEIVFIQSGGGVVTCDGENHSVSTGDIVIYDAGVVHREDWFSSLDPLILLYLQSNIQMTFDGKSEEQSHHMPPVLHTGTVQAQVSRILWSIYREITGKHADYEQICDHLFANLLLLIRRLYAMEYTVFDLPPASLASQIRAYIDRQNALVSLNDLSEHFHVSVYHLSHVFKDEFGISPIRYANQQRIERAKLMLRTSMYTVAEIAQQLGFENPPNFNHMFKSYTGSTPVNYRSK